MKSILMLAVLAAAPAMAMNSGDNDVQPETTYLSWCDSNNVIAQDSKGQLYVRANCNDSGLICKTTEVYRGQGSVVSATCVAPK